MKKLICVLASLIMLLASTSALADDFTLHSEVMFGMTTDEVILLEESKGFTPEKNSEEEYDTIQIEGEIASIPNSDITYYFKDDILFSADYYLNGDGTEYEFIQQALVNKYGEPTGCPDNMMSRALEQGITIVQTKSKSSAYKGAGIVDVQSWLLPRENGDYILIQHFMYRLKTAISFDGVNTFDYHHIGYQYFAADDPIVLDAIEKSSQLSDDI